MGIWPTEYIKIFYVAAIRAEACVDEKRNKKHNPQCGGTGVNADVYDCNRCNISEGGNL